MVDFVVGPVPAVVLPEVLDGGDGQDEEDRGQGQLGFEGVDGGHKVEQGDEDEVDIGQTMELLEEVLGQEGERRVLGGLDGVGGVVSVGVVMGRLPGGVIEQVGADTPHLILLRTFPSLLLPSPPHPPLLLVSGVSPVLLRHRHPSPHPNTHSVSSRACPRTL